MKANLRGKNFESDEGIIDAVDEYFGNQEDGLYFERISKLEQRWRKCFKTKGNYTENNGTISALGHSQSTGAENVLIVPRFSYNNVEQH